MGWDFFPNDLQDFVFFIIILAVRCCLNTEVKYMILPTIILIIR